MAKKSQIDPGWESVVPCPRCKRNNPGQGGAYFGPACSLGKHCCQRENLKDGDILPMVGGPKDGQQHPVNFIFPFLNGGLPPARISFTVNDHNQIVYSLNKAKRCWEYATVL